MNKKCENCGKEHNGSYGTGRFCSDHCCRQWCGKKTQKHVCNFKNIPKEGGWECPVCHQIFKTRHERTKHNKTFHPERARKGGWNKGLTAETDLSVKKGQNTFKRNLLSGKIDRQNFSHLHTEETKKLLSEKQKKYLDKCIDTHPYFNHTFISKPEKFFLSWLKEEGINFQHQYPVKRFKLDFLIGNIDLEIDGEQHYNNFKQIDHDKERTIILESLGYKVVRIRWKKYNSLPSEEQKLFLLNLKTKLLNS